MSWLDERIKTTGSDTINMLMQMQAKIGFALKSSRPEDGIYPSPETLFELATMARRAEKSGAQHHSYRDMEDHAPETEPTIQDRIDRGEIRIPPNTEWPGQPPEEKANA